MAVMNDNLTFPAACAIGPQCAQAPPQLRANVFAACSGERHDDEGESIQGHQLRSVFAAVGRCTRPCPGPTSGID